MQIQFLSRDHPFVTLFIDATGQLNAYGYPLHTAMVINPLTMRGIPIVHMLAARSSAKDLTDMLAYVKAKVPTWNPKLVIIDKDLSEYNGINEFACKFNVSLIIFLCYFHVKQAIERWMKLAVNKVPVMFRDTVHSSIAAMHFAATEAEFYKLKDQFLCWAEQKHKGLWMYMKTEWFSDRFLKMWSRAFVPQLGDYVSFVNNFIEAWHKLLKSIALVNKHNRRLDQLIHVLIVNMEKLLYRALHGHDLTKLRNKMTPVRAIAMENLPSVQPEHAFSDIPDGKCAVLFGGETFLVSLRGGWTQRWALLPV